MPRPSTHKPPDYDHLSIAPASMLLPLEPLLGLERADRQSYSDRDATATQTQTHTETQTMASSDASLAGGLALMICVLTVPVAEWQNKAAVVCNLIAWHATWSSQPSPPPPPEQQQLQEQVLTLKERKKHTP